MSEKINYLVFNTLADKHKAVNNLHGKVFRSTESDHQIMIVVKLTDS